MNTRIVLLLLTGLPTLAWAQMAAVPHDPRDAILVRRDGPRFASNQQGEASFTTATIRPASATNGGHGAMRIQPGGVFEITNISVRELIEFAYQRYAYDRREVIGGPSWIDSDRFDITVKAAKEPVLDPDGTPRQTLQMIRELLADRFGMRSHEEPKERDVYALKRANDGKALGPRLRPSTFDCSTLVPGKPPELAPGQHPPCGHKTPPGRLFANTVSIPILANLLAHHVDRPVVDATGLTGRFDVELESSDIKTAPGYKPGPSDLALPPAAGPSIFIAVQQQLGLKLEATTAPINVVVVDAVARAQHGAAERDSAEDLEPRIRGSDTRGTSL